MLFFFDFFLCKIFGFFLVLLNERNQLILVHTHSYTYTRACTVSRLHACTTNETDTHKKMMMMIIKETERKIHRIKIKNKTSKEQTMKEDSTFKHKLSTHKKHRTLTHRRKRRRRTKTPSSEWHFRTK